MSVSLGNFSSEVFTLQIQKLPSLSTTVRTGSFLLPVGVTSPKIKGMLQDCQAGDTLEGVANWWVMRQRLSESTKAIQRALVRLKKKGLMLERKIEGGWSFYVTSSSPGKKRQ